VQAIARTRHGTFMANPHHEEHPGTERSQQPAISPPSVPTIEKQVGRFPRYRPGQGENFVPVRGVNSVVADACPLAPTSGVRDIVARGEASALVGHDGV